MKRAPIFTVVAMLVWAVQATAGQLPPGGTLSPLPLYNSTAAFVTETPLLSYSFGTNNTGMVQEWVFSGYGANPYVNGTLGSNSSALTFVFEVLVSTGDVTRATSSNYGVLPLDVGYGYDVFGSIDPPGPNTIVPVSADRSADGNVVGFNFTDITAGQTSAVTIVNSNADYYTAGTMNVSNSQAPGGGSVSGAFVPTTVPEPSALNLLAVGSLGLVGYGCRRSRVPK
jgi:hypothetical protein